METYFVPIGLILWPLLLLIVKAFRWVREERQGRARLEDPQYLALRDEYESHMATIDWADQLDWAEWEFQRRSRTEAEMRDYAESYASWRRRARAS
jgi:hypothetical protein